jgi:peroxiredoxin-like protein
MEVRSKRFTYRASIRWSDQKRGQVSSIGKPDLAVATPPEFKGHEGVWSPEDLFVASVNACIMSTFLAFAERAGLAFASYESEAEGVLELVDGKFQFTTIAVKPRLGLKPGEDPVKARDLLAKAEANCLVSNSIKAGVTLEPVIEST